MQVTIESVLKNKQLYNGYVQKVLQDRKQLMQQVAELRKNKQSMTDEKDIARNEFDESKLIQEINSLTNSFKGYKLTLEQLDLQQDVIEGRIDKETYAKGMDENKRAKVDLSLQEELEFCENEVDKCKKALKVFTLDNDIDDASRWEQALNKAIRQLKDAQEKVMQQEEHEEEKTEKQEQEQEQEQPTEPYINESGKIIRPGNDEKVDNNQHSEMGTESTKEPIEEGTPGFKFWQEGKVFTEKQEQVLTDYSGKELGSRVITDTENLENGVRTVEIIGNLENEDGKYSMKEVSKGIGTELEYQRKDMTVDNKITGQKEQYAYQKDNKGNELYYHTVDGKTAFRMIKNSRGTTIENYDSNGNLSDVFEYDADGKALTAMGDIKEIDENYVQNYFDGQVPYFEAENRDLGINDKKQSVLDSAEEAVNENTRTGKVNEQAQTMKAKQQERMNPDIEKDSNDLGLDDE